MVRLCYICSSQSTHRGFDAPPCTSRAVACRRTEATGAPRMERTSPCLHPHTSKQSVAHKQCATNQRSPTQAKQSKAKQSKAKQSKAKQSKAAIPLQSTTSYRSSPAERLYSARPASHSLRKENASSSQLFLLCLSRACLGKLIVCTIQMASQKRRFVLCT